MGQVIAPYGVHGWIRVRPYTETPDGLLAYSEWWLGGTTAWSSHSLIEGKPHSTALLAKLDGVNSPEAVASLRGLSIAIARSALPVLSDKKEEYYWADLVGLKVVNIRQVVLGSVIGLMETGAHDVLRVRPPPIHAGPTTGAENLNFSTMADSRSGPRYNRASSSSGDKPQETLIPFVSPITHRVDLKAGIIEVDWELDY